MVFLFYFGKEEFFLKHFFTVNMTRIKEMFADKVDVDIFIYKKEMKMSSASP